MHIRRADHNKGNVYGRINIEKYLRMLARNSGVSDTNIFLALMNDEKYARQGSEDITTISSSI